MDRSKILSLLLIVTSVILVIAIVFLIYFYATRDTRENVIDVKLESGESSSLKFENLTLLPGESCEYELELSHRVKADYDITLSFSDQDSELTLKSFVYAKVTAGDEVICDTLLSELFDGEALTFSRELSKDKAETVKILYYMPSEVGNEAKNAEAKFNLVISADNTGGIYD